MREDRPPSLALAFGFLRPPPLLPCSWFPPSQFSFFRPPFLPFLVPLPPSLSFLINLPPAHLPLSFMSKQHPGLIPGLLQVVPSSWFFSASRLPGSSNLIPRFASPHSHRQPPGPALSLPRAPPPTPSFLQRRKWGVAPATFPYQSRHHLPLRQFWPSSGGVGPGLRGG